MDLTYKVKGADGKDYGPVSHERLVAWMREGRVSGNTEVMRSDVNYWAAASQYSELQVDQSQVGDAIPINPAVANRTVAQNAPEAAGHLKSSASWFYWIAAFSVINTIILLTGANWLFYLGLGVTQYFGVIGREFGSAGNIVAVALNLFVVAVFVLFGVFAHKRHTWAFITGMVLYTFDGLTLIPAQMWIGVGFHAFVLFYLFRGLKACIDLNRR